MPLSTYVLRCVVMTVLLLPFFCNHGAGAEEGEGAAGTYFSLDCPAGVDVSQLMQALDLAPGEAMLAGTPFDTPACSLDALTRMLDALYVSVCAIMDIHVTNFHGVVAIVPDQGTLQARYRAFYAQELGPDIHAFYDQRTNTIVASPAGMTKYIVGHEMAHAVLSRYFVVQAPVRIQEVLAGYVEYQLRKRAG